MAKNTKQQDAAAAAVAAGEAGAKGFLLVENLTEGRLLHIAGVAIPPGQVKPIPDDAEGVNRATVEYEPDLYAIVGEQSAAEVRADQVELSKVSGIASAGGAPATATGAKWGTAPAA